MSFIDYLASLPAVKLDKLYESHWTCQAVLRSLPPVAKQYVLRLLHIEAPITPAHFQNWARPDALSKHRVALERLEQLRVLLQDSSSKAYRLNPELQKQLRRALSTGGGPPRERISSSIAVRVPTLAELDQYSVNQWESVLLQLVAMAAHNSSSYEGGGANHSATHPVVLDTFLRAGLLESRDHEPPRITEAGFQYLLMPTNAQLWQLIREYVSAAQERGTDSGLLIAFLLELGFHTVGEPYGVGSLSSMQQGVLDELALLGLLMLQKGSRDRWFIPTRLAANLSASLSESQEWQPAEGFIVVETNYRVYAYTASKLQRQILRLFVRVEYQLPNLVVGALTRESCNAALRSGITASQMIDYLRMHAHPQVAQRKPVVPETVTDQIRLWEKERNRVGLAPAFLYDDFPAQDVFDTVVQHARDLGVLLWHDPDAKRLVVHQHAHDEMRNFIRRQQGGSKQKSKPTR